MSVGGLVENLVDNAGADELGWLNSAFSGLGDRTVPASVSLGDSTEGPLASNDRGGINEGAALACVCLCSPSMWSGSGEGMRARGPGSGPCEGVESYEFERWRPNAGFARAAIAAWSYSLPSGRAINKVRQRRLNKKSLTLEDALHRLPRALYTSPYIHRPWLHFLIIQGGGF